MQEKALMDNCIGEFGICIDDEKASSKGKFTYLIAGKYTGGEVPEGMMLYEFEQGEWAVFDCVNGETTDADYHSAIWIPVKRR